MNRRSILRSLAYAGFFSFILTTSFACGGGGGNDTASGILTARFTADDPTPPAASVSMQAGSASATDFAVRIAVTDTNDVYGAAFDITYPPALISYQSFDSAGSFLRDGGVTNTSLNFTVDAVSTPGRVIVAATRLGPLSGVNVAGTRDLLVLRFRARTAFLPQAIAFDAVQPRTVRSSANAPIAVTWSSGSVDAIVN
jgi:hypothetical protein